MAGNDLDDRIPAVAVDEAVDIDTGFPLHPEHRAQSPDRMRVQHLVGIVAPVIDHHIVRRQRVQVGQRRLALIAMRMRVEVDPAGRSRPVVGTATDTGNSPDPADSGHRLPASASLHAPVRAAGSGRFHRPQIPDAPATADPCRAGLSVRVGVGLRRRRPP